ncbi:MAG: type II toxin-antitoxin system RelE/ParE family toxin [Cyanobacteria bacterium SZAS LIN-2]|nr:type II toxin-antitoxin system RelE/ParE family toxin [Cyanobacteria bacterium SZAS LIN-3]MBS1994985.1 type II toxin-antitoxin system RelE/ParE family toxin [Cyanobacteria bacterium SZAS LIN-2]
MDIQEYLLEDGSSPYKKWFDSLDPEAAAKVVTAKLRMERGLISAIKWFDGIGEYKIDWGPGYRIYLAKDGDKLIVLFGGGTKKRQEADIQEAKRLHQQYKERKARIRAEEKAHKKREER